VAVLGWFLGFHGTPLWARPATKKYCTNTNNRLKYMEPTFSGYSTKKACFSRNPLENRVVASLKMIEIYTKMGMASKISHAMRAKKWQMAKWCKDCH
jgi:hypothetical protein